MSKKTKPTNAKALATMISIVADEKIAVDITVMKLDNIEHAPSEYFVICTCGSEPQMKAVVDAVEDRCIEVGIKRPKVEGFGRTNWIILDFFDVVMHIMLKESREFYRIEKLWSDAEFFTLSEKNRLIKKSE